MKPNESAQDSRLSLALTCGLVMYACAAGYGAYFLFRGVSSPFQFLGIFLGLPALATVFFLLAAFNVPGLLAPGRLVFPLNLTLPLVFAAFVVLSELLLTSTGNSLIIPFDKVQAATFWIRPSVLVLVTLSQMLCLTALTKLRAEPGD